MNDRSGKIIARSIRDGAETTLQNLCYLYADQILETIDLIATRLTGDRRWLRIDLSRIERFADNDEPSPPEGYYPEDLVAIDPFQEAMKLEGLTGVKLASNGDPVWLLIQHKQFREAMATFGEQTTFGAYLQSNYPDRLFDADDPHGEKKRERESIELAGFEQEMKSLLGSQGDEIKRTATSEVPETDIRDLLLSADEREVAEWLIAEFKRVGPVLNLGRLEFQFIHRGVANGIERFADWGFIKLDYSVWIRAGLVQPGKETLTPAIGGFDAERVRQLHAFYSDHPFPDARITQRLIAFIPEDRGGTKTGEQRPPSTNARMIDKIQKVEDAINWSARAFAEALGVSTSTVHGTPAWKQIMKTREATKLERLEKQTERERK